MNLFEFNFTHRRLMTRQNLVHFAANYTPITNLGSHTHSEVSNTLRPHRGEGAGLSVQGTSPTAGTEEQGMPHSRH